MHPAPFVSLTSLTPGGIRLPPTAPVTSVKSPFLSTTTVGHPSDNVRLRASTLLYGNRLSLKEKQSMSLLRRSPDNGDR